MAANLDEDIRAGGSVDGGEEEETAPSQQSAAAAAPGSSLLALDRSIRGVVEEEEGEGEEMEDEEVERLKGAVPGAPSGGGAGTEGPSLLRTQLHVLQEDLVLVANSEGYSSSAFR